MTVCVFLIIIFMTFVTLSTQYISCYHFAENINAEFRKTKHQQKTSDVTSFQIQTQ